VFEAAIRINLTHRKNHVLKPGRKIKYGNVYIKPHVKNFWNKVRAVRRRTGGRRRSWVVLRPAAAARRAFFHRLRRRGFMVGGGGGVGGVRPDERALKQRTRCTGIFSWFYRCQPLQP